MQLQRKVEHVLACDHSSAPMVASLRELSTFFDENSLQNRRNLGRIIERRSMEQNMAFIDAFDVVADKLDAMRTCIDGLQAACASLHADAHAAKVKSAALMSSTTQLSEERAVIDVQSRVADEFVRTYQLSAADEESLASGVINDAFFEAIDHIHHIRNQSKDLLSRYNQRAGLDIMDNMAVRLEAALDTVCRATLMACRALTDANPDVGNVLHKSLKVLRQRPAYFNHCVQEITSTRRGTLVQRFADALTRGGPNGMPKPIEIHAHDSLRYTSDMLAWIHQAVASERDLATALYDTKRSPDRRRRSSSDLFKEQSAEVRSHLDAVFDGLARPLRVRVAQAFQAEPDDVIVFQISTLLKFYHRVMSQLLSPDSSFASLLSGLQSDAYSHFFCKAGWIAVVNNGLTLLDSPARAGFRASPVVVASRHRTTSHARRCPRGAGEIDARDEELQRDAGAE